MRGFLVEKIVGETPKCEPTRRERTHVGKVFLFIAIEDKSIGNVDYILRNRLEEVFPHACVMNGCSNYPKIGAHVWKTPERFQVP